MSISAQKWTLIPVHYLSGESIKEQKTFDVYIFRPNQETTGKR